MSQLSLSVTLQPGYSQEATGMIQTSEGDYILVGRIFNQTAPSQAFAIRFNPKLVAPIIWQKTYSDTFDVFFQSVAQIADGSFIAVGTKFRSQTAFDEVLWIVNLDAQGNLIWQTTYGQQGIQTDGYGVVATRDGFVVAGAFYPEGYNGASAALKFSMERRLMWEGRFFQGACRAMAATQDGGFVLAGYRGIPGSLNSYPYLLRLDGNGSRIWEQFYSQFPLYEIVKCGVAQVVGGFIVVVKGTILGINTSGTVVWSRQNGALNLSSVLALPGGNYAVGGGQLVGNVDHAYVASLDPSFQEILWDNTELLSPSSFEALLVNRDALVTGFGDMPWIDGRSQLVFVIFYPTRKLVGAAADSGQAE